MTAKFHENLKLVFSSTSGTTSQLRVRWSRRDGSPLPRSAYESGGGTLFIRGVKRGDAGDYACEAVDARSGAVAFTAVTTLTVSGEADQLLGHSQ